MQPPKLLTKEHMIASFCLVDLSRIIRQTVDEHMRKVGLTRAQWFILHYIYHYEGSTQQDLADMVYMGKSALAKQLVTLESKGWIYKSQHETDRRSWKVFITNKMKPAVKDINKMAEMALSPLLDQLGKENYSAFINTLKVIEQHLEDDLKTSNTLNKVNQMVNAIADKYDL